MCLMGTQGSLKILPFALHLYPTLGVNNGDANTQSVKGREQRWPACFPGRDALMARLQAGWWNQLSSFFTPLSKGQFSQHNTHFQVIFNLAWKCLLYPRPQPAELMGNTHLGSCALPRGEVSSGGRRVEEIKDSSCQPPAAHGDLTHPARIVGFHPYLWLLWVAIGFPSFPLSGSGVVGVSGNLSVVLSFWS